MKKTALLLFSLTLGMNAEASIERARTIYQGGDKNKYPQLVEELLKDKMYFSSVPFIKEYLVSTGRINNAAIDKIVDEVVTNVGVKQFEILPVAALEKSSSPTIRYILAKKFFNASKLDKTLDYLKSKIEESHPVKPYALFLEASTYALMNKTSEAEVAYKECVRVSNSQIKDEKRKDRLRQLQINRDYCVVGTPRIQFAAEKFQDANSNYLDLSKNSFIWPEVLFEEAWNSFYLKDYNRTLGKLVSYKAPVFDYIFNPEIDVLKALTYMEMCLWDDTNKTVEDFYSQYQKEYKTFSTYIDSMGKDLQKYYSLVRNQEDDQIKRHPILKRALLSVSKDPAYVELYEAFDSGKDEIEKLKNAPKSPFKNVLANNLKDSLSVQRNLIGSYTRGQLLTYRKQLSNAFEEMSYIKLEVLSKRKSEIYEDLMNDGQTRKRGNIAHLKRNDKQYFWNFNGEFWADELGDYVFSLKSECK